MTVLNASELRLYLEGMTDSRVKYKSQYAITTKKRKR